MFEITHIETTICAAFPAPLLHCSLNPIRLALYALDVWLITGLKWIYGITPRKCIAQVA
jgi:hypothetical protein